MRAHEFIQEQTAMDIERARIDIIGLGHLILFGTLPVGKDAQASIKELSKVGLTYPELHQELYNFYKKKKDPHEDCIPIIKKWLVTNKPNIASELHSEHWEHHPKSSNMMSSNEKQKKPPVTS